MNSSHSRYERSLRAQGFRHIAGVDEVGRGPLAGPVVAAAVIMPVGQHALQALDDSKVLTERQRGEAYETIQRAALAVGIGIVDHETIDRINILQASFLAMEKAISGLDPKPDHLLIDGNRFTAPSDSRVSEIPYSLIIDGDAKSYLIAAASIVAKVTRDRLMTELDDRYPGYGFAKHKGYSTPEHREAIFRLGQCEIHRRSFSIRTQIEIPFE